MVEPSFAALLSTPEIELVGEFEERAGYFIPAVVVRILSNSINSYLTIFYNKLIS